MRWLRTLALMSILFLISCLPSSFDSAQATPAYVIHPRPNPNENGDVVNIERQISATQAQQMEQTSPLMDTSVALAKGLDVDSVVRRIGAVSERPNLYYRVHVLSSSDVNAAALADGRAYITLGMLDYLKRRGSSENELAFIIGHEIGHICAQHLVKRVQEIQQQAAVQQGLALLGQALVQQYANPQSQNYAQNVYMGDALVNLVTQAIYRTQQEGYLQEQELEADQLGLRYMIAAGYQPWESISLQEDMDRFAINGPFLQTHPRWPTRAEDSARFLRDERIQDSQHETKELLSSNGLAYCQKCGKALNVSAFQPGSYLHCPFCNETSVLRIAASSGINITPYKTEGNRLGSSSTTERYLGITIIGAPDFIEQVKEAIVYLQRSRTDIFQLITTHISAIAYRPDIFESGWSPKKMHSEIWISKADCNISNVHLAVVLYHLVKESIDTSNTSINTPAVIASPNLMANVIYEAYGDTVCCSKCRHTLDVSSFQPGSYLRCPFCNETYVLRSVLNIAATSSITSNTSQESYLGISIIGGEVFRGKVKKALDWIKGNTPRVFSSVAEHIETIEYANDGNLDKIHRKIAIWSYEGELGNNEIAVRIIELAYDNKEYFGDLPTWGETLGLLRDSHLREH